MSKSIVQRFLLPAAIIVSGFTAVVFISGSIENNRPPLSEEYEDADLRLNGSRLKGFMFGTEGLMADWYYMRALQYIGDKILKSKADFIDIEDLRDLNPRLLYPFLDNATDLDPHYLEAYMYGAIVLPAIDPQSAIALTEKGVANNPEQWRLYRLLGYTYWRLGRFDKASENYEKGSQIDGSPVFMKLMAAAMKTKGGSREPAREIYREMLTNAPDDQIRITADRRLKQLDSLDEREAIDQALAEFKELNGRCPASLHQVLPKLMTVKLPENREFRVDGSKNLVDPSDAPYILDSDACRVLLDLTKTNIASQ
jgi:tetratricopeptide (TPR) repeat protein